MTAPPGQFLAGKRIIVAGAGFAGLAFVLALDQLWQSATLDRPEVLLYEENGRDEPYKMTPILCASTEQARMMDWWPFNSWAY